MPQYIKSECPEEGGLCDQKENNFLFSLNWIEGLEKKWACVICIPETADVINVDGSRGQWPGVFGFSTWC